MYVYLLMMEKDAEPEGTVVFTHTNREKAIAFGIHMRDLNPRNAFWIDAWPQESSMTYQNVKTVWAVG